MKTHQLIEIENVKNANRALKNLLERPRTEIVGLGLFYGKPGLGKSRWAWKIAFENQYVYLRLECNAHVKDFLKALLSKLRDQNHNVEIKGTQNEIYNKILDIFQSNQNIVVVLDEIEYGLQNRKIIATVRDFIDQSLATFVLVGMEHAKSQLRAMPSYFYSRCHCYMEFKELSFADSEKLFKEVCEVAVDNEILKYVISHSNGTIRILNKYIEVIEKINKRLKKSMLAFDEIKDILAMVEVK